MGILYFAISFLSFKIFDFSLFFFNFVKNNFPFLGLFFDWFFKKSIIFKNLLTKNTKIFKKLFQKKKRFKIIFHFSIGFSKLTILKPLKTENKKNFKNFEKPGVNIVKIFEKPGVNIVKNFEKAGVNIVKMFFQNVSLFGPNLIFSDHTTFPIK